MKAVALLLDGLPLQPPESSERNGADEKENLFYKCVCALFSITRRKIYSKTIYIDVFISPADTLVCLWN